MTEPYAMVFEPILKEKVWGGRRLERFGKTLRGNAKFGESWEIADLVSTSVSGGGGGSAVSVIRNGGLAGRTIGDAVEAWGPDLLGTEGMEQARVAGEQTGAGRPVFPLLIKYLDAGEHLSVQAHPSPAYAEAHPGANLKTESWFVIDASATTLPSGREIDPSIFVGLREGVTENELRARIAAGESVAGDLRRLPARLGECHTLPSGTLHALGAGVLVAEVQTPSDTTFRVYDWVAEYGRPERELHINEAAECIDFLGPHPEPVAPTRDGGRAAQTEYYSIDDVRGGTPFESGRMSILMVIAGRGSVTGAGEPVPVSAGTTVLIPAAVAAGARLVGDEGLRSLVIRPG